MAAGEISFNEEKNILLKKTRGVNFDDVLEAIEKGDIVEDKKNQSKKYLHQGLLVVKIGGYIYAVPYVFDKKRNSRFLKTVFPSRKLNKSYGKTYEKK